MKPCEKGEKQHEAIMQWIITYTDPDFDDFAPDEDEAQVFYGDYPDDTVCEDY